MEKKEYTKPALTIDEQISLLQDRGLQISNEDRARHYLTNISYYRLAGYWWSLQYDKEKHLFKEGSSFETVINLYDFDRELRLVLLNAIERIEVSIRTRLIYQLSLRYNPWWFEDQSLFRNKDFFEKNLESIDRELSNSKEVFIKDHNKRYKKDGKRPPAWKTLETVSMGTVSKLYGNLDIKDDKNKIAKDLYLPNFKFLESWLRCISEVRNICAHHNRLWNRNLVSIPEWFNNPEKPWTDGYRPDKWARKIYSTVCCMQYLLNTISPGNSFASRYMHLFSEYPEVDPNAMGFPESWEKQSVWQY